MGLCGWLGDVYCVGVKKNLGPKVEHQSSLPKTVPTSSPCSRSNHWRRRWSWSCWTARWSAWGRYTTAPCARPDATAATQQSDAGARNGHRDEQDRPTAVTMTATIR